MDGSVSATAVVGNGPFGPLCGRARTVEALRYAAVLSRVDEDVSVQCDANTLLRSSSSTSLGKGMPCRDAVVVGSDICPWKRADMTLRGSPKYPLAFAALVLMWSDHMATFLRNGLAKWLDTCQHSRIGEPVYPENHMAIARASNLSDGGAIRLTEE